jgi:hypothetical protein
MDFPDPQIPANVYYFSNEHYIQLDNVQITYLQDEKSKVRIIMATDKFGGYESYLAPGPWMVPYSFSWMNDCIVEFVEVQTLLKYIDIGLLVVGSTIALLSMYISFHQHRHVSSVATEVEMQSLKNVTQTSGLQGNQGNQGLQTGEYQV